MSPDPVGSAPLPPDTVAFYTETPEERNRLSSFFRLITVIPHVIFLWIYGIGAFFVAIGAWFAIVFTGKFPEGMYSFLEGYARYYTRVYAYGYLLADKFPPFSGNPEEPYEAHFQIGPPKEKYSRWKAFFRFILVIPFAIVAYVFLLIYEIAAIVAWFAILFTGKNPKGIQDAMVFGFSYVARLNAYYFLLTEDWPVYWTDDAVRDDLASKGYSPWPPGGDQSSIGVAPVEPPSAPEPPAPPAPPEAPQQP
jgi:hypothetical protein